MDQKSYNTGSGAVNGAAQGYQSSGSWWGALAGGVLGGAMGSQQPTGQGGPYPNPAPAPVMPGAVQGNWGGMYRDPYTGAVYFSDTSGYGAANPSTYQNQALINALMGGNGGSNDIYQRQLQGQIDLLTKQAQDVGKRAGQSIVPQQFVDPAWLNAQGTGLVDISNPNGIDRNGLLFHEFMQSTGGNYGSKNRDISFAKWVNDAYKRNAEPQWQQFANAQKEQLGNQSVQQAQLAQLNKQIDDLKTAQNAYGQGGTASLQNNPLLANANRMDEYAKSAGLMGTTLNNQTNAQADEAMRQSQDQAARRGLAGSGISEMVGARLGLQKAQQLNENQLASQRYGSDATQAALSSRLGLLGYLQGQNTQGLQNQISATNANLGQLGLGYGASANAANAINNWNVANTGQQNAYNMNQWNMGQLSQMNANNNAASAAGSMGYLAGSYYNQHPQQQQIAQNYVSSYNNPAYQTNNYPMGQNYTNTTPSPYGGSWEPDYLKYGTSGTGGK